MAALAVNASIGLDTRRKTRMRSHRPQGAASHPRGHHVRSVVVRVLSVTAAAAMTCILWAGTASAAPASASLLGTKTKVSASPNPVDVGAAVKLTATVTSPGHIPAGVITFTWNGHVLCSARTHYGVATCDTTFTQARSYWVQGTFPRDRYYWGSYGLAKVTVVNPPPTKYATTTAVTSPKHISTEQAGTPFTVTATVASVGGGAVPTGTVSFAPTNLGTGPMPGYLVCNATLVDGTGSCTVEPPVGTWGFVLYQATYSGDATHTTSMSKGEHKLITPDPTFTTVQGPATATTGNVTITANVVPDTYSGPGYNILGGFSQTGGDTVAFAVDGTTVCTASALQWNTTTKVNYATCAAANLAAGNHQVVATYSGDEYTNGSTSKPFTITVG
jgi:hypothetical protein